MALCSECLRKALLAKLHFSYIFSIRIMSHRNIIRYYTRKFSSNPWQLSCFCLGASTETLEQTSLTNKMNKWMHCKSFMKCCTWLILFSTYGRFAHTTWKSKGKRNQIRFRDIKIVFYSNKYEYALDANGRINVEKEENFIWSVICAFSHSKKMESIWYLILLSLRHRQWYG